MKKVKIIFAFIICVMFLFSAFVISASASSATFSINADYESLKVGDTFDIVVAVNNIHDDVGIVIYTCDIYYDTSSYELVDWEHNKPESWGNFFEDFSAEWDKDDENYFKCGYLYGGAEFGLGITEDNVLFTTITFKVLSEEADGKEFALKNASAANDNMQDIDCSSASVIINLEGEPVVSQGDTINNSEEITDDTSSEDVISNTDASVTVSSDESSEPDFNDNNDTSDDKDNENTWKIIFGVLVVVIIILFGIYLYSRRKKQ
ncbi:MAG: hypothetical protein A2Y15_03090 [Clostridiales bacterium GWF2_36_10]|nr:MAG: hypothetical protein A2Y15_03090 [Clostridiales bacterium GWF2_36_10]